MIVDLPTAITDLFPTALWRLEGDDFDGLEWISEDIPKPSRETLETRRAELQAIADERKRKRSDLLALWESLPSYITGPYLSVFQMATQLLNQSRFDEAADLIRYEEPRKGFDGDQVATFEAEKAKIVSAIESMK